MQTILKALVLRSNVGGMKKTMQLIQDGKVKVNNRAVTNAMIKVAEADILDIDGMIVSVEELLKNR